MNEHDIEETGLVPVEQTPNQILALAVSRDADPSVIEKMMDLQERLEANDAKKEYVKAMTAFKQAAPAVLGKDGAVDFSTSKGRTHYKYATLGGIVLKTTALMGKHGLSVSWSTDQHEDGSVTVTCHITHVHGHSESVTLTAPPDDSGNKNKIQQIGSTVTYLQRYTFLAVVGFATADQDDDGQASGKRPDPPRQPAPKPKPAEELADEAADALFGDAPPAEDAPVAPPSSGIVCPEEGCGAPMKDQRAFREQDQAEIDAGTRKIGKNGKPVAARPAYKCTRENCTGVIWSAREAEIRCWMQMVRANGDNTARRALYDKMAEWKIDASKWEHSGGENIQKIVDFVREYG